LFTCGELYRQRSSGNRTDGHLEEPRKKIAVYLFSLPVKYYTEFFSVIFHKFNNGVCSSIDVFLLSDVKLPINIYKILLCLHGMYLLLRQETKCILHDRFVYVATMSLHDTHNFHAHSRMTETQSRKVGGGGRLVWPQSKYCVPS
jgi:hypothetical protein